MPRPDRIFRTEGVILRRQDLGEADRILTLYTREHGKIKALAKGARKPTSRKAGYVELFMRLDMLIARGHSLDILSQAEIIDAYLPLRSDLVRAMYASHLGELVDAFMEEGDENSLLYALLTSGLGWIASSDDLRRTARYFELHFLDAVGFKPQLFRCVISGEDVTAENQYFSAAEGGVIRPAYGHTRGGTRPISLNALKVLRYMQTRPIEVVDQLQLSPSVQDEIERLMHETLTYHLERRLKSAAFLKRLRREAARQAREQGAEGDRDPEADEDEAP